jgi:hypothetical protein
MPTKQRTTAATYDTPVRSEYGKLVVQKDVFFAPIFAMFETQRNLSEELAAALVRNFERFTEIQTEVANSLMGRRAVDAFGFLSEILQVVNAAMIAQPVLSAKMGGYLEKVRPMMGEIGREFGADGFTIEYGVPSGVTVAFHFSLSNSSNTRMQATR